MFVNGKVSLVSVKIYDGINMVKFRIYFLIWNNFNIYLNLKM